MAADRRDEARDAARDRQRARTQRGLRSSRSAAAPADRLPSPPRERRPVMAALAVLLVVGGAAVAGLVSLRADERVQVLVAKRDIAVGEQVTRNDFVTAPVAAELEGLVTEAQASVVDGVYAVTPIPAGRLLDALMLNQADPFSGDGDASVGVPVPPARVPAEGLEAGDLVQVVRVTDGTGEVLVDEAVVADVTDPAADEDVSVTATTTPVATLKVSVADAPAVAAAAAADQLALVVLAPEG